MANRMETPSQPASDSTRKGLRTFWALNGVMFQGALSDNLYKFILVMLVIKLAGMEFPEDGVAATSRAALYQTIVEAAFILPYILAVSIAGWLGDRFSKVHVTRGTKVMEIGTMILATGVLWMGQPWFAVGVLFLMGLQSALFSPSKYGILPEILSEGRIAWGNGILQGWTFLAIIVGTIVGPWIFGEFESALWIPGILLVVLAVGGLGISMAMGVTPSASPEERVSINPLPLVSRYSKAIWSHVGLKWSVFGAMVWWLVAVMCQGAAILIARQILGLTPAQTGMALLPIVVGIGIGCMATGFISRNRIEMGLVPFGALAMFGSCILVWWVTPTHEAMSALSPELVSRLKIALPLWMGLVGLVCGFFIVPLQSYIVQTSDPSIRGGIWATTNVLTAGGMVLGVLIKGGIVWATASPGDVFLVGGLLMLVTGIVICLRFPMIPLRFLILVVFRGLYRMRVVGADRIPKEGGALLIANHQSYLDAVLLSALTDRPVRFLMSDDMFRRWYLRPVAYLTKSIPISSRQGLRELLRGLHEASDEIQSGGVVAIFPEGQLTRIGMLQPFRRGVERIMKGVDAPIIPIAIDGAYDTVSAMRGGRMRFGFRTPFRRRPINVAIGNPLPPDTPPAILRRHVLDLMVDAFAFRKDDALPMHREAIRGLRRRAFKKNFADHSTNGLIPGWKLLAATVALGTKLRTHWKDQKNVGILLPPSIAGTAVNVAASLAGQVSVNLNYTASLAILETICDRAHVKVIITSRAFVAKASLTLPSGIEVAYLEDIAKQISKWDRVIALLRGLLQPLSSLERSMGRTQPATLDDIATLIFSSGSTGIPKGVPLTHWNLWSNCTGAWQQIDIPKYTRLLGVLPFFHSFGYLVALWLPLFKGFGVVFYPNPLDGTMIGQFVERYHVTHMFGTPTFLSVYTRRVSPEQFGSLEFVITGAEKLRPGVAAAFERQFGVRVIEGYGCTECSPVVTMSTHDFRAPGFYQRGYKPGSIGHPIPGVTLCVVDLQTGEPLPIGESGMLLVKGPNVMMGYYEMPEQTAEVFKDGWYITGDVAQIDEDGFVIITDRLSRFSKIGGEMVPHIRIEEALHRVTGIEEIAFAVTGVADANRGERLAVLYTLPEGKAREAAELLQKSDLPALWIPKWTDFIAVEEIPALGTGKMDLRRVREIATAALSNGKTKSPSEIGS